MGSKTPILDFVIEGINDTYMDGGLVCDLFSGSCTLAGALRGQVSIFSNDIQQYSSILANAYLCNYDWQKNSNILNLIAEEAKEIVSQCIFNQPKLHFDYSTGLTLENFAKIEIEQRDLIKKDFDSTQYHLFTKYYSGTYWSYEQCIWIDSIRSVAEKYKSKDVAIYYAIMVCLMYAMAYTSQSTGHYAQFRDGIEESAVKDILIYRTRDILTYFTRKFQELQQTYSENNAFSYKVTTLDYRRCLEGIPENTTVYADPPYAFVHYSRFYHILETLVLYDYPKVRYKGRYRDDRHQSPFCIKTEVEGAFEELFGLTNSRNSNLVLSYSNTGMISLDRLSAIAEREMGGRYSIEIRQSDHEHSTMGRRGDRHKEVKETLIICKKR
jgi:Adenine-specific DNA methylase